MTEGYVSHPDNIALIGEVARMPMIYYILRDASGNNWKERKIRLTVSKIKKYLGMLEFSGTELVKEAYPKFSQFKKNVLDNSIADINRLKQMGQLDVCVSYEPIYNGKRKVGNPAFIEFCVYDTLEQMRSDEIRKQQAGQPVSFFADAQRVKPGEKEWQQLVAMLDGEIGDELRKVEFVSFDEKKGILLKASRVQAKKVESCLTDDVIKQVKMCSVKVFGKVINWNYSLSDK